MHMLRKKMPKQASQDQLALRAEAEAWTRWGSTLDQLRAGEAAPADTSRPPCLGRERGQGMAGPAGEEDCGPVNTVSIFYDTGRGFGAFGVVTTYHGHTFKQVLVKSHYNVN